MTGIHVQRLFATLGSRLCLIAFAVVGISAFIFKDCDSKSGSCG